jgi:hypothetical protein
MNEIELMRGFVSFTHRGLIEKVIRMSKSVYESGNLGGRQLDDEIQIVSGTRNTLGIAGH